MSQKDIAIVQLPDEEIGSEFDRFVEAWEQHQAAEIEFRTFEAKTNEPLAMGRTFEGIESFMQFNRQRREYVGRREELRRDWDDKEARLREHAEMVRVLLPTDSVLIHNYAGSRYVIRNDKGRVAVQRG
jgi:hypothetical protein